MYARTRQLYKRSLPTGALIVTLTVCIAGAALAMPPHPSVLEAQAVAKASGQHQALPDPDDLHARGICTPDDFFRSQLSLSPGKAQQSPMAGSFRVLALLVDFSDHVSAVAPPFFDTLVFDTGYGTVRNYFDEVSYGQIDLVTVDMPSAVGWTRAPQTYAYYVDGQNGTGSHPQNSQGLVEDLVDAVDGVVDFSMYDNDSDGDVDVLLVIHSGTGAELSGSLDDIWSHKWAITPRLKDGVYIQSYTIQPEYWSTPGDMTIGVYAHELSHGFGLPDLYDTDGSSNGIGNWGLMAFGSWNGTLGNSPAHPCAWSRIQMGFASYSNVTVNLTQQAIDAVNNGGSIYRLWTSGGLGDEYFLVENRQQTSYDAAIPGSGLLVWHIDDNKSGNQQEWYPGQPDSEHYLVALEQADGLFELEHASGYGDASDPFPGSGGKTALGGATSPTTDSYQSGATLVAVTNISSSAPTIYADMAVGLAADVDDQVRTSLPGSFTLAQNYPNPFNPTTTMQFTLDYPAEVRLNVYNILGQHIKTLWAGHTEAGSTTLTWNATDKRGIQMASGVYFYKLEVGDQEETIKMLLVQ